MDATRYDALLRELARQDCDGKTFSQVSINEQVDRLIRAGAYPVSRPVSARLTVRFADKDWDAGPMADIVVGQRLWMVLDPFSPDFSVFAWYVDAAGNCIAGKLTETNTD